MNTDESVLHYHQQRIAVKLSKNKCDSDDNIYLTDKFSLSKPNTSLKPRDVHSKAHRHYGSNKRKLNFSAPGKLVKRRTKS